METEELINGIEDSLVSRFGGSSYSPEGELNFAESVREVDDLFLVARTVVYYDRDDETLGFPECVTAGSTHRLLLEIDGRFFCIAATPIAVTRPDKLPYRARKKS